VITGAFPHPSNLPSGRESNHNNKFLLLRHYRHTKNHDHLCPLGERGKKRRCSSLQLISNTSHNHQNNYFCAERSKDFVRGATSAAQSRLHFMSTRRDVENDAWFALATDPSYLPQSLYDGRNSESRQLKQVVVRGALPPNQKP
jgi:hypothetical protein